MNRRTAVAASVALCAICGVAAVAIHRIGERKSLSDRIVAAAQQCARSDTVLDLGTAVPGEWDTVGVFPPYSTMSDIERTCSVSTRGLQTSIESSDSMSLLVFVAGDSVFAVCDIARDEVDFTTCAPVATMFRRGNATFTVANDNRTGMHVLHVTSKAASVSAAE